MARACFCINEENLHRHLANNVKNYQLQDEAKNRNLDETKCVDVEWFMRRLNGNCQNCGCRFEFDVQNGYLANNITAPRLNTKSRITKTTARLGVSCVIAL